MALNSTQATVTTVTAVDRQMSNREGSDRVALRSTQATVTTVTIVGRQMQNRERSDRVALNGVNYHRTTSRQRFALITLHVSNRID
jgi:hypothetical protein